MYGTYHAVITVYKTEYKVIVMGYPNEGSNLRYLCGLLS